MKTIYQMLWQEWDDSSALAMELQQLCCRPLIVYIANIMAADVLAMQGARASVDMILTLLNRDNSVHVR